jgi:hypothetical protein
MRPTRKAESCPRPNCVGGWYGGPYTKVQCSRARALKDGILCYLRKPPRWQAARRRIHESLFPTCRVNWNTAPLGSFASAHNRPP